MIKFNHFNFNVFDLARSLDFYENALGLFVKSEKTADDGSFKLVYLSDGSNDFSLELTYLSSRTVPYDLGELEYHLAFVTDEYENWYKKHKELGLICYENKAMGIYFISDPDGYWIEIVPER